MSDAGLPEGVYVHPGYLRKGVGGLPLGAPLETEQAKKMRTVAAVITGHHAPGIALYRKAGFVYSGRIEKAGFKMGQVVDVVFYQWFPKGGFDAG